MERKKQLVLYLLVLHIFFYIEAEKDSELDIEISMDYVSENVIAFMNIDEHSSKKGSSVHNTYCYLQYLSTENKKSIFTKKYSVWSQSTKYVSSEIKPKTCILNLKILIKVSTNYRLHLFYLQF